MVSFALNRFLISNKLLNRMYRSGRIIAAANHAIPASEGIYLIY